MEGGGKIKEGDLDRINKIGRIMKRRAAAGFDFENSVNSVLKV
jgi:hypothetical protein